MCEGKSIERSSMRKISKRARGSKMVLQSDYGVSIKVITILRILRKLGYGEI